MKTLVDTFDEGEIVLAESVVFHSKRYSLRLWLDGQLWTFGCSHLHLRPALAEKCRERTDQKFASLKSAEERVLIQSEPYPIIEFRWTDGRRIRSQRAATTDDWTRVT